MEHTNTLADALIVTALCAIWVAYLYFKHRERLRRLEIIHQERLAAMEKGIPLPELPFDATRVRTPPDPRAPCSCQRGGATCRAVPSRPRRRAGTLSMPRALL